MHYLRIGRVAEMLDISRPSVYDLIRHGHLRGVTKIGARLRVPEAAVYDLIERGLIAPTRRRWPEKAGADQLKKK